MLQSCSAQPKPIEQKTSLSCPCLRVHRGPSPSLDYSPTERTYVLVRRPRRYLAGPHKDVVGAQGDFYKGWGRPCICRVAHRFGLLSDLLNHRITRPHCSHRNCSSLRRNSLKSCGYDIVYPALLAIVNRRAILGAGARPSRVTAWPFVKSARPSLDMSLTHLRSVTLSTRSAARVSSACRRFRSASSRTAGPSRR